MDAPPDQTLERARQAMVAEGLDPAIQDDGAGTLHSDWVVWSSDEEQTWIYRVTVIVAASDDALSRVDVRSEVRRCPPQATRFDLCGPMGPITIAPKFIQRKAESVSERIAGGSASS